MNKVHSNDLLGKIKDYFTVYILILIPFFIAIVDKETQ
jgi:hypothetical protein